MAGFVLSGDSGVAGQSAVIAERERRVLHLSDVGDSGRARHIDGSHRNRSRTAGGAGLGRNGILDLLFGSDGDTTDRLSFASGGELRAVLHGRVGVRAVHSHGDARADADFSRFLIAGGISDHGKARLGVRADLQLAVQLDICCMI